MGQAGIFKNRNSATTGRGYLGVRRFIAAFPRRGATIFSPAIELPQHSLDALNIPGDEPAATVRMAAAMKLSELDRISCGAAAELARVPKPVFLSRLAEFGVETFRFTEQELLDEAPLG